MNEMVKKSKAHEHHDRAHGHRDEADFRRLARRNKLFGLWVAELMDFHGDAAEAYAREVVLSDLEEPGEDDIFRKVTADLARHGKTVSVDEMRKKLDACLAQVMRED